MSKKVRKAFLTSILTLFSYIYAYTLKYLGISHEVKYLCSKRKGLESLPIKSDKIGSLHCKLFYLLLKERIRKRELNDSLMRSYDDLQIFHLGQCSHGNLGHICRGVPNATRITKHESPPYPVLRCGIQAPSQILEHVFRAVRLSSIFREH